ncbi:MAG: hypothetical protein WCA91_07675 [Candidatus Acidiferrales bacterium]
MACASFEVCRSISGINRYKKSVNIVNMVNVAEPVARCHINPLEMFYVALADT